MAKSAFQKRFPYGRLFLLVAILIALPIVLWSVQKAPTQTQEHAAAATCATYGGTCFYGQCSGSNFPVQGVSSSICNSNGYYVCCAGKLLAATGLKDYSSYCTPANSSTESDLINFNWNRVRSADKYILYYKLYGNDSKGNPYPTHSLSVAQDTQSVIAALVKMTNNHGRNVQWWVKALKNYYPSATSTSAKKTTLTAHEFCP